MRDDRRKKLVLGMVGTALFLGCVLAAAVSAGRIDQRLYSELLKFPNDRKIVEVDGVPCLKIFLSKGQSLNSFCRFVRYFDNNFRFFRQQIALINRLEPMAVVGGTDNLSTDVEFIYVPLNFSIRPKILPERLEAISRSPKFIRIDIGQQCIGLYEYGRLVYLFPISSGKKGTPTKRFTILSKDKDLYSSKYDNAWMPYSLHLFGDYFLHAGILPSYAASHGCVRLMYDNAIVVYNWAEIGTPGEIINGTAVKEEPIVSGDDEEKPDLKVIYY